MALEKVSKAVKELQDLAETPPKDGGLRKQLYKAAEKLCFAIEDPQDTIYRVVYSVSRSNG